MKRLWHHWQTWECVPAGMYETVAPLGATPEEAERTYAGFLNNLKSFERGLNLVLSEWPISCQQFLSNPGMNRIAWLGQASMCITTGVPRQFKGGFRLLSPDAQTAANLLAERYLSYWEGMHGVAGDNPPETTAPRGVKARVAHYLETWSHRGYPAGIPDEVPPELMRLNLAPSYKAISQAILKNDHALTSLGYSQPVSPWYDVLKRIELRERGIQIKPNENDDFFTTYRQSYDPCLFS